MDSPDIKPPFFTPEYCGSISGLNLGCFGWVRSSDSKLVAVYLYGAVTAVQAVYSKLISNDSIYLQKADDRLGYNKEWGNADSAGYQKIPKSPKQVEGTENVSLVIASNALMDYDKENMYCYIPDTGDEEELAHRLIFLLRKVSFYPILDEWGAALWEIGLKNRAIKLLETQKRDSLKGIYNDVFQCGFRIYEFRNDDKMWEKLIQEALKSGEISIPQNSSKHENKPKSGIIVQFPDGRSDDKTLDEFLDSEEVKNLPFLARAAMNDAIAMAFGSNGHNEEEDY